MAVKAYDIGDPDLNQLCVTLEEWFLNKEYDTQVFETPRGLTLQARGAQDWIQRHGFAVQVEMRKCQGGIEVEVGKSLWEDKTVAGVASAMIFWRTFALPAYIAFSQAEIMDETWRWLDQHLVGDDRDKNSLSPFARVGERSAEPARATHKSDAALGAASPGVDGSGHRTQKLTECGECGAELEPGANYCDLCGARVGKAVA